MIAFRNFEKIREWSRALLETNRVLLNQFLAARKDLEVRPLQFGTMVFPQLLTGPVDKFCELFREKYDGTVVPGSFFEMPDHFRIGIGGETEGSGREPGAVGRRVGSSFRNRSSAGCAPSRLWRTLELPATVAMVVSPGKVVSSAPCAQPSFSASSGDSPDQ